MNQLMRSHCHIREEFINSGILWCEFGTERQVSVWGTAMLSACSAFSHGTLSIFSLLRFEVTAQSEFSLYTNNLYLKIL